MIPKVDTFEADISDEIRRKEATLAEISAASNNVGNNDTDNSDVVLPKRAPLFFFGLIGFFVLCLLGFGILIYFYLNDPILSPGNNNNQANNVVIPKAPQELKNISQTLDAQIGRYVTRVEKRGDAYILTIGEYSPVFAYMTRNENAYIEELGMIFAATTSPQVKAAPQSSTTTAATSTQKTVPVMPQNVSTSTKITNQASTTAATSTQKVSTSTSALPAVNAVVPVVKIEETQTTTPTFSDVTLSNQNMRVWKYGNKVVVYAFIGSHTVVITNSVDQVLALRSAILK